MKKNRLFWILMLAVLVPALVLSACEKKKYHYDDEDEDESTEQVESGDSDVKKEKKKLIYGEYKLDKESFEAFFGEDIEKSAKA